ncbi:MAG: S-layer homology domain-containing protein [Oscillospiraceae bacterium]|nr:S-layer homology domain-containing protein [Oscillospiraceae bacterium]
MKKILKDFPCARLALGAFLGVFLLLLLLFYSGPATALEIALEEVSLPYAFDNVSAGAEHAAAIDSDGNLWAWGDNIYGQLGDGTTENRSIPVKIAENFVEVSAGRAHTLALASDGSLFAWGDNTYGQLGDGSSNASYVPIKIMDNVVQISAGYNHSTAIKSDGSLYAWGQNNSGQLGDGTNTTRRNPVKIMDGAAQVSAGHSHTLAINDSMELYAWGDNSYGQLGNETFENSSIPVLIMYEMTQVSAGYYHSAAVNIDGYVYAWGDNSYGQLGNDSNDPINLPIFVTDGFVGVSAGDGHTFLFDPFGNILACGDNYYGQLGDGTNTAKSYLVFVASDIKQTSAGEGFSVALTSSGQLFSWGNNASGQLGDDTYLNKNSPVQLTRGMTIEYITTEEPTTEEPTTEEPTTEEPTTEEPTTEEPTTEEPTTEEPETNEVKQEDPLSFAFRSETGEKMSEENEADDEEIEEIEDALLPLADLALESVKDYIDKLTPEQKSKPDDIDLAILFAENEIANYASVEVRGDEIIVNEETLKELQAQAELAKELVSEMFYDENIEIIREIKTGVTYKSSKTSAVTVKVEPSATVTTAENVKIQMPDYAIYIPKQTILADVAEENLYITTEKIMVEIPDPDEMTADEPDAPLPNSGESALASSGMAPSKKTEIRYKVILSRDLKENIKYSFSPVPAGDYDYQAVFCSNGNSVGGKYNPITQKIDTRIRFSDIYTVKINKKDFSDLAGKSARMREAVTMLASKGIINGTSATTFEPDGKITRAEITAMIVRTLISRFDENEDGEFLDVTPGDWYFGAIGTAKSYGIIKGMSQYIFAPNSQIKKEQIIAIAARTLRSEMKYITPKDSDRYLKKFLDKDELPEWGLDDFALASMADLIVLNTEEKFRPNDTLTRGEAAIILYRLFMKIW